MASEADWAEAHGRERVVRPLAAQKRVAYGGIVVAMAELGLSRLRVHQLVREYRAAPCAASLLPVKQGRKRGERRLPDEVERLIARGIEEHYLTREKPKVEALRRWLRHECRQAGIQPLSRAANHRTRNPRGTDRGDLNRPEPR